MAKSMIISISRRPFDFGVSTDLKTEHVVEGKEPRSFWDCMGIIKKWKSSYYPSKPLVPLKPGH